MSVYAVDDFVDEHNTGQMDRVNMSLRSADVCIDPTTRPFPCGQAVPYDRFFVRFVVQGVYCHDFRRLPVASCRSVRVSCPCVDARLTRRSKLPPSLAVSR